MSIDNSMVKQFTSNIYHYSQQKDSRIWNLFTRSESINGEEKYFDAVGGTDVMEKTGRNQDTTFTDFEHFRRRLTMRDYFWATLVDKTDKLRLIHSPESEYSIEARNAFARKLDDIAIAALLGTVWTGKTGTTPLSLPNASKLAATKSGDFSGFSVETLINLKYMFDVKEIDDKDRHIAVGAAEIRNLLNEDKVTNADYANIKALVHGEVDTFMGFKFHRLERLPSLTVAATINKVTGEVGTGSDSAAIGSKRCIAFTKDALIKGIGANITSKATERADKHYATQLYMSMSLGAMRNDEDKVIEILVKK